MTKYKSTKRKKSSQIIATGQITLKKHQEIIISLGLYRPSKKSLIFSISTSFKQSLRKNLIAFLFHKRNKKCNKKRP